METIVQELKLTPVLKELGASLADVSLCLGHHIAGRSGSVLCSMFSHDHIRKNVRAINELSSDARMVRIIDTVLTNCRI